MSVAANIKTIRDKLATFERPPALIAVSKTKPLAMLQEAYDNGQRLFGENYIQELTEKVPKMPKDVQWHVIGHVQTNKVTSITRLVNEGYNITVETIDSQKLAEQLNKRCNSKVNVMVEVHTSQEESKSGASPEDVLPLVDFIKTLPQLNFVGLMTIGDPQNPEACFKLMAELKQNILEKYPNTACSLSMGMSSDYEVAIKYQTDYVRIGTAIFGAREYKTVEQ